VQVHVKIKNSVAEILPCHPGGGQDIIPNKFIDLLALHFI